jgi:hypothetical protein
VAALRQTLLRQTVPKERLTGPRLRLQEAQAMISTGHFSQAEHLAHEAYRDAPDDPVVFAEMMKVHADLGLALDRPEEYPDAVRILSCAHSHDQTDRNIHRALGERHYQHAVAMHGLNDTARALTALHLALSFDPKHAGANRLLQELTTEKTRDPTV